MDIRPKLPNIFPQREDKPIPITEEEHFFKTFLDGEDNTIIKDTYTLNKAPVSEIIQVSGTYNENDVIFTEGEDYEKTSYTTNRTEEFTFKESKNEYHLTEPPEEGSVVIKTEDGQEFTSSTDTFSIEDLENNENSIEDLENNENSNIIDWSTGDVAPADDTDFSVNYTVVYEDSAIKWIDGRRPDSATYFYVTYKAPSVISRYISAAEDELENVSKELDEIIESKFIETASGSDLDRIGQTFGDLGKRQGRNDTQYRIYLKSVIQSFGSRGTKGNIKRAMSAATDVKSDNIEIIEEFEETQYEIRINSTTPINGTLVAEIAEIADPSGVELKTTRYTVPKEEISATDSVNAIITDITKKESQVTETIQATDIVSTNTRNVAWDDGDWSGENDNTYWADNPDSDRNL